MRPLALCLGLLLLAVLWLGPLPAQAELSFAAHMVMHMGVVAVAAPLLAMALARSRLNPLNRLPPAVVALPAALFELVVVWGWHAPAAHDAARLSTALLVLEQGMFLLAGLVVWLAALAPESHASPVRRGAGVLCLMVTSMHMTLLGALLALAPRVLYQCLELCAASLERTPLEDQSLGGVVMLAVGGVSYLIGGLAVMAPLLRERPVSDAQASSSGAWR